VLEEAISETKKWQENGYRQIPVSVNVSNIQLDNPCFFDEIKEIMEKYELEAKYLNLEITESFMAQRDRTMEFIKKIKEYGIKISIDDFGTGYSSLQYLIDTPFD